MRKPIQISTVPATVDQDNELLAEEIVALCNDGTIWVTYYDLDEHRWSKWRKVPDVPTGDE